MNTGGWKHSGSGGVAQKHQQPLLPACGAGGGGSSVGADQVPPGGATMGPLQLLNELWLLLSQGASACRRHCRGGCCCCRQGMHPHMALQMLLWPTGRSRGGAALAAPLCSAIAGRLQTSLGGRPVWCGSSSGRCIKQPPVATIVTLHNAVVRTRLLRPLKLQTGC
jgi:hypothetical protein